MPGNISITILMLPFLRGGEIVNTAFALTASTRTLAISTAQSIWKARTTPLTSHRSIFANPAQGI
jgi:hypothetical protein